MNVLRYRISVTHIKSVLLVVVIANVLSPVYSQVETLQNWSMFGHDASHTWSTPSTLHFPLQIQWSVNYTTVQTHPAVVGDSVFVATSGDFQSSGKVYSLDRDSGLVRWTYDTGGTVFGGVSPAVSDDLLFLPISYLGPTSEVNVTQQTTSLAAGAIIALQRSSGKLIWSRQTLHPIFTSPAIDGGSVYVVLDGEGIFALDVATGSVEWFYPVATIGTATASPIAYEGAIYVPLFGKGIFALDARTGVLKWQYAPEDARAGVGEGLTAGSGMVFITISYRSQGADTRMVYLVALAAQTGHVVWKRLIYNFTYSPPDLSVSGRLYPALVNRTLIVTGNLGGTHANSTGGVIALDAETGGVIWSSLAPVMDNIAVAGSSVIGFVWQSLMRPPTLVAFDAMTGLKVWEWPLPILGSAYGPTVAAGSLYVAIWTLGLYSLGSAAGIPEFNHAVIWAPLLCFAIISLLLRKPQRNFRNSH
jgi:outer membrane protein assembly factor BamB